MDEAGAAANNGAEKAETGTSAEARPAGDGSADAGGAADAPVVRLIAKWNGKEHRLEVQESTTVGDVRRRLQEMTNVQPKRQKLIGLGKKPNPGDDIPLGSLHLKNPHSFMMVGCPDEKVLLDASEISDLPEVVNDLDWDFDPSEADAAQANAENRRKLEEKIKNIEIRTINPPRPGKKLLVLDLDYTLLDFKGTESSMERLKRPFCDEMLEATYAHYDIVIWSQTSWRWLELKLTEMGILQNPKFQITFVLDRTSMFSVESRMPDGRKRAHEVKPLEFIWSKFPEFYSASNTVHVDDLSRNFAMNPKQGLKISAFKESVRVRGQDRELRYLSYYLVHIALHVPDFCALKHSGWMAYVAENVSLQ